MANVNHQSTEMTICATYYDFVKSVKQGIERVRQQSMWGADQLTVSGEIEWGNDIILINMTINLWLIARLK